MRTAIPPCRAMSLLLRCLIRGMGLAPTLGFLLFSRLPIGLLLLLANSVKLLALFSVRTVAIALRVTRALRLVLCGGGAGSIALVVLVLVHQLILIVRLPIIGCVIGSSNYIGRR